MKNSRIIFIYSLLEAFLLFFILYNCCKNPISKTDPNTVTISPRGGEYSLPTGITLKVPAGAVTEKKDISLRLVQNADIQPILDNFGFIKDNLVIFIVGEPDGIVFNSPVEIILSADMDTGEIPLLYEFTSDTSCTISANANITIDPD